MPSEARRLPHALTSVTSEEMFQALGKAWVRLFEAPPTKESLCLLVGQSAFETGWWKYMHNFNIGNVKSRVGDGCDYTYFRCWEILSPIQAAIYAKDEAVEVEEGLSLEGKVKAWFAPDHPVCRFRAYESLDLAAVDFLNKLTDRFSDPVPEKNAWAAVLRGDAVSFCHALKLKGYYTGSEEIYTKRVKEIFELLCKKPFDVLPFSTVEEPDLTDKNVRDARHIGMLQHFGKEDGDK